LKEHFSYLLCDEAAQFLETEFLIPCAVLKRSGTVVFFGDHKQLGPIVRSPICTRKGFDISTMERFFSYNFSKIKLNVSYRAHPAIMKPYSDIFYDGSLINECEQNIKDLFVGCSFLKNKDIPNMFIHVEGKEERDADSPSWYNTKEIEVVLKQIQAIQNTKKIQNSDIGIITPYRKQVEKFRGKFRQQKPYDGIDVNTTECFQGQERKVIIISCVRSNSVYITNDLKYRLGFLSNAKRLNVAISRAQSLLIIVGNAQLLATHDENWKKLLQYYIKNSLYDGPVLELLSKDAEMTEEDEDEVGELNADHAWKEYQ